MYGKLHQNTKGQLCSRLPVCVFVRVLMSHPRGCMGWYVIYYQAYHSHITHVRKSDQPVIIWNSIVIARGIFKQQNDKASIDFVMNYKDCN